MGEALSALAPVVAGMLLFMFREQIAETIKRGNEVLYRRLPRAVGDPLLRHADTFHGWMAFGIAMGGLLWIFVGLVALAYVLT